MKRSPIKRRTPLKPKVRNWKKELDALCKRVVFARDKNKCVKTGETANLQWAHIASRRYLSTRWDPDNSLCLSAGAHLWWHHRPLEAVAWFEAMYPNRAQRLRLKHNVPQKFDREATRLYLEQELLKYGG